MLLIIICIGLWACNQIPLQQNWYSTLTRPFRISRVRSSLVHETITVDGYFTLRQDVIDQPIHAKKKTGGGGGGGGGQEENSRTL